MLERYPYQADYAIPPGETLRDTLEALSMSQKELAQRTDLSTKHINQVIQGIAPITPETAISLERATGVAAGFWGRLEANYQARRARIEEESRLVADTAWLKSFPLKELITRNVLTDSRDGVVLLRQVFQFFGVASRSAWERLWLSPQAAFRRSPAFQSDPYAVAAWLRLGELAAASIGCAPFDRQRFKALLADLRSLTRAEPARIPSEITSACAGVGVAVVYVTEVKGARVSGAARWLAPDKAMIQLSNRYGREDHFWFSFYHEAGHLLEHGKRRAFVDDGEDQGPEELEADRFAAEMLIPRDAASRLPSSRKLADAVEFAENVGLSPGIVIGRLQREGSLSYRVGNHLRRPIPLPPGA